MATPSPAADDLTKCGICKETIIEPKALPCLHTFCLVCLQEWTDHDITCTSVACPTCKKSISLPDNGVDGLPGNVFVSSLMERSQAMTPNNVACVCCGEDGSKLLARCLSCDGFLCQEGINGHQTLKFLRNHEVINLDDLQSGKVKLSSVLGKKPTCSKHKGQALWFFCETCSVLVCRDCTVVNHKSPEHVYIELESAIKEQKGDIQQLVEESVAMAVRVNDALQGIMSLRKTLDANAKQVTTDIENAAEQAIKQIRKICKAEKEKLDQWVTAAYKKIDVTEKSLHSQQSQVKRAQDVSNQVLNSGSDYDLASVYQQLKTSLQEGCSITPALIESYLGRITFKADDSVTHIQSLGNLDLGVKEVSNDSWVLKKEFAQDKLKYPSGVAITPSGDIAVTNMEETIPVHVFGADGKFKFSLDKKSSNAWNVAVAPDDGRFFVTTEHNKCVIVYSSEGHYLFEFPAVSPGGVIITAKDTCLSGIAITMKGQVLVGEINTKSISIHDLSSFHINSIKVPICPGFIATRQNTIVVSACESDTNVHVLDFTGKQLYTIEPPQGVTWWCPCGVCISVNDEICIANYDDKDNSTIHCFTTNGKHLGCIYSGLETVQGIALMENDKTLVVAEYNGTVKVLTRKK